MRNIAALHLPLGRPAPVTPVTSHTGCGQPARTTTTTTTMSNVSMMCGAQHTQGAHLAVMQGKSTLRHPPPSTRPHQHRNQDKTRMPATLYPIKAAAQRYLCSLGERDRVHGGRESVGRTQAGRADVRALLHPGHHLGRYKCDVQCGAGVMCSANDVAQV